VGRTAPAAVGTVTKEARAPLSVFGGPPRARPVGRRGGGGVACRDARVAGAAWAPGWRPTGGRGGCGGRGGLPVAAAGGSGGVWRPQGEVATVQVQRGRGRRPHQGAAEAGTLRGRDEEHTPTRHCGRGRASRAGARDVNAKPSVKAAVLPVPTGAYGVILAPTGSVSPVGARVTRMHCAQCSRMSE